LLGLLLWLLRRANRLSAGAAGSLDPDDQLLDPGDQLWRLDGGVHGDAMPDFIPSGKRLHNYGKSQCY